MFNLEEIIEIIIMIVFIASFLCAFYFLYVVKVEEQTVKNQVDYIVADLIDDVSLLPDDKIDILKKRLNSYKKTDTSDADKSVDENNDKIFKNVIVMIVVTFLICMTICYFLCRYYKIDFFTICGKNLIILVFIGLTEFTFLNVFGRNFISADPNFVKLSILNRLTS